MPRGLLGAATMAALVSACAISPTTDLNTFAGKTGRASFEVFNRDVDASQTLVLPVAYDRQTEGPACGAHALASLVKYWRRSDPIEGAKLFHAQPPKSPQGYSMEELMALARKHGLTASGVRIDLGGVTAELEKGRPVLLPVRMPSIYVQQRTIPVGETPVIGTVRNFLMARSGTVSEITGLAMVSHYLLVIGHGQEKFVVIDPVMGYRTISAEKLARYRKPMGDAAIVAASASGKRR